MVMKKLQRENNRAHIKVISHPVKQRFKIVREQSAGCHFAGVNKLTIFSGGVQIFIFIKTYSPKQSIHQLVQQKDLHGTWFYEPSSLH